MNDTEFPTTCWTKYDPESVVCEFGWHVEDNGWRDIGYHRVVMPDGASAAHAFGAGERTERIDAALEAILNFGTRNTAAIDVLTERRRQIESEGWTREHDDQWRLGEIGGAAACYTMQATLDRVNAPHLVDAMKRTIRELWPWASHWWKPTNRRRDLVKAAALILAEIERLDREEARDD